MDHRYLYQSYNPVLADGEAPRRLIGVLWPEATYVKIARCLITYARQSELEGASPGKKGDERRQRAAHWLECAARELRKTRAWREIEHDRLAAELVNLIV